jgi:uncharacterized protein YjbI with pentapeptide repeats
MDRDEAIRLLQGGYEEIAEWNRRRANGEEVPDLSGASISDANLLALDVSELNLIGEHLIVADLRGANLSGGNFSRADLRRATLCSANLSDANLSRANLTGADLSRANLTGAVLREAYLSGTDLTAANLSGANLAEADLMEADLSGANLTGANLTGANLIGANLSRANLSGATLIGVNLTSTDLRDARLSGADLSEANLSDADLTTVNMTGANLGAANLSGTRMPEAPEVQFSDDCEGETLERPPPISIPAGPALPELLHSVPRLHSHGRPLRALKSFLRRVARRILRSVTSKAIDPVDCTVFATPAVTCGSWLIVQVFAHRPDQTEEAMALAEELDDDARRRGLVSLEMEIERGTPLQVHASIDCVRFDSPIQNLVWQGRPTYVAFKGLVAGEPTAEGLVGTVTVSREGIPIGSIIFKVKIINWERLWRPPETLRPVTEKAHRYKRAFISYASQDRREVLKRVQMLRLARIRYFHDVLKLEPGDRWERKLYLHIDKSDLFLLFWSTNAKASKWVLEEVRYAIKRKGGNELAPPKLIPVIIEGPPVPEPPQELAHLHFNDYLIYFSQP